MKTIDMSKTLLALTFTFVVLLTTNARSEYFSSIFQLQNLFESEKVVLQSFENFVNREIEELHAIRAFLDSSKGAEMLRQIDFKNPIASFVALKRFYDKWKFLFTKAFDDANQNGYVEYVSTSKSIHRPTKEDLVGAAYGIARLQRTYQLPVEELAEGIIKGVVYSKNMTANDCFILGVALFEKTDYKNAFAWLLTAKRKFVSKFNMQEIEGRDLQIYLDHLTYLCHSAWHLRNFKLSLFIGQEILQRDPWNELALNLTTSASTFLKENIYRMSVGQIQPDEETNGNAEAPGLIDNKHRIDDWYTKTCSGEFHLTEKQRSQLHCRYVTNDVAYRLLGPFKQEELFLDPKIVMFHEAITESEVAFLKHISQAELTRSGIYIDTISDVRISQTAWVKNEEYAELTNLGRRLEDFTKLNMQAAEDLQVVNYGVGGHYVYHYDFYDKDEDVGADGSRIATALFYANKIELGGGTALPFLNLTVPPIYRSMVLWFNHHRSGSRDYRLIHGGCPVLKGSKWIVTKWFHEISQTFHLPCSLQPEDAASRIHKEIHENLRTTL